jgi:CBS domain-containing protein
MPLLLGTKGQDILSWRATGQLVTSLEASLSEKWGRCSAREAEGFLGRLIESLDQEIAYEEQYQGEIDLLEKALNEADEPKKLKRLEARYREVVCAHFSRRGSILSLCEALNRLHDLILGKAALFAQQRMLELGQGKATPFTLLVSGDRGRGESTLYSQNRYFLLQQEESPSSFLFSRQLTETLSEAGLLATDLMFWHGTVEQWSALLSASFPQQESGDRREVLAALPPFAAPLQQGPQQMPGWAWRFEALADLAPLDPAVPAAAEAFKAARATLEKEREQGPFLQLARRVLGLPLAIGRFGGWRTQRDGEHRGEVNLEELALSPLVMTLRVLAIHSGIFTSSTVKRVSELLERGALDVELAGRLLKAYQCLMQHKVQGEIRSEEAGFFMAPEDLGETEEARLRDALESVLNLQKIAYQRLVGYL